MYVSHTSVDCAVGVMLVSMGCSSSSIPPCCKLICSARASCSSSVSVETSYSVYSVRVMVVFAFCHNLSWLCLHKLCCLFLYFLQLLDQYEYIFISCLLNYSFWPHWRFRVLLWTQTGDQNGGGLVFCLKGVSLKIDMWLLHYIAHGLYYIHVLNHITQKHKCTRPRCHTGSPTVQDMFRLNLMTRRWGLLSYERRAAMYIL